MTLLTHQIRRVLFIGGVDSSGAAGLGADLSAAHAFGVDAATVVTATTVQSTAVCHSMQPVDADVVDAQLTAAAADGVPAVVKTGLLAHPTQIRVVADHVRRWRACGYAVDLIVDPVLNASSGQTFFDEATYQALQAELLPLTDLVTPNRPEAARITVKVGMTLIKGGHASDAAALVEDMILSDDRRWTLSAPRLSGAWRGTGCRLAAGVAVNRVLGQSWLDAILAARAWLQAALSSGTMPESGPGRLPFTTWHQVTAAHVPDLWSDQPKTSGFAPLGIPIGVYPIVDHSEWIPVLAAQGVRTIQLRIKDLRGDPLQHALTRAIATAKQSNVQLFINDHWREAIKAGAYGVHLGQEDLDTADLQAIQHAGLRLGVSTHSYAEAARGKALRPSYLALGPIRPTTCKAMRFGPQGFDRLDEWRRLFFEPLVAIGGLTLSDVARVRQSGCDGIAAVSAILKAASPGTHAAEWVRAWSDYDVALLQRQFR